MSETIGMFYGKPINDMSREELLEVIRYLADENSRYTTPKAIRARALGEAEMLKRGDGRLDRPSEITPNQPSS